MIILIFLPPYENIFRDPLIDHDSIPSSSRDVHRCEDQLQNQLRDSFPSCGTGKWSVVSRRSRKKRIKNYHTSWNIRSLTKPGCKYGIADFILTHKTEFFCFQEAKKEIIDDSYLAFISEHFSIIWNYLDMPTMQAC
jgi:hypothetical protein